LGWWCDRVAWHCGIRGKGEEEGEESTCREIDVPDSLGLRDSRSSRLRSYEWAL